MVSSKRMSNERPGNFGSFFLKRLVLAVLLVQALWVKDYSSLTATAFSPTHNPTVVSFGGGTHHHNQILDGCPKRKKVQLWNLPQLNSEELKDLPRIVDFPTPNQLKVLRKEATKRQARKAMARFFLPEEEMFGPFSSSIPQIIPLLEEEELVEIRSIAKNDKREVFATTERLTMELEMELQRDVTIVSTKGFTSILYSPMKDNNNPKKIPLRTSVGQKNSWVRRTKAERDNRGQIIQDNNNNKEEEDA